MKPKIKPKMKPKMKPGISLRRLALSCLVLFITALMTLSNKKQIPAEDAELKLRAAACMEDSLSAIRQLKSSRGLDFTEGDIHKTGIIGEAYTLITTTSGALEAKRTCAHPDMAALMVELLRKAGVKNGDRVAAGLSGSFPGMNIALLSACRAMGVDCTYIASIGASTYGANQPECTFPEMSLYLYREGLIDSPPALITPGGAGDLGTDMDPQLLSEIESRLNNEGYELTRQEDFQGNIRHRLYIYGGSESKNDGTFPGDIKCFIGVGGNITTTGPGEKTVPYGYIPPRTIKESSLKPADGLIQRYNAAGVPVIHILNIKKLVNDYGLPYDPESPGTVGESAVYHKTAYPLYLLIPGLAAGILILFPDLKYRKQI